MSMKKLHLTVSDQEVRNGFFLLFSAFLCVPYLLSYLNQRLTTPIDPPSLNLIYHTVNLTGAIVVFSVFLKKSAQQLRIQLKSILVYAVIGLLVYFLMVIALSRFILWLKPDFANLNDHNIAHQLDTQWIFAVIGTVIMAPLTEELMFRGHLFGHLYNKSPAAAYLVSMCAFSLVHILGYVGNTNIATLLLSFLQYLPAGWVLAWAYAQTGSILTPIIIHTLINAIAIYTMR